jgi:hypothetical protein
LKHSAGIIAGGSRQSPYRSEPNIQPWSRASHDSAGFHSGTQSKTTVLFP